MVCIAGVLGNKQVALGPLAVEAGIFAFLLLVVTSSAVAELHGRTIANRLVLFGFVPMIFSMLLTLIVLQIPASPTWTRSGSSLRDDPRKHAANLVRRHSRLRRFDLSERHDLQPAEGHGRQ